MGSSQDDGRNMAFRFLYRHVERGEAQSKHPGVAALKPSPVGEGGPLAVEEDNFNNLHILVG